MSFLPSQCFQMNKPGGVDHPDLVGVGIEQQRPVRIFFAQNHVGIAYKRVFCQESIFLPCVSP